MALASSIATAARPEVPVPVAARQPTDDACGRDEPDDVAEARHGQGLQAAGHVGEERRTRQAGDGVDEQREHAASGTQGRADEHDGERLPGDRDRPHRDLELCHRSGEQGSAGDEGGVRGQPVRPQTVGEDCAGSEPGGVRHGFS
ncbi:hypothetical protein QP157_13630 [Sphingomonas sp. LR61]